jgi:hypothetical protein
MARLVTMADCPTSGQEDRPRERSHDSRDDDTRFMRRLDDASWTKLRELVKRFGASKAVIIRQLIAQANNDDFPKSWQIRAAESCAQQAQEQGKGKGR